MSKKPGGSRRQGELFPRSKRSAIALDPEHPLVRLADLLDWDELLEKAERVRARRVKNRAGRPPHLRALLGAMLLRATKKMTFRDAEDQIRYYAPARYLCGLTESDWTPDHDTIHDFIQLMGEEGTVLINEHVVKLAVAKKLADPSVVVGDTTAQEAAIPHPSEIRLMAAFLNAVTAASSRAGKAVKAFVQGAQPVFERARRTIRKYHLFAKTKEVRDQLIRQVARAVSSVNGGLGRALKASAVSRSGLVQAAQRKAGKLNETMSKLLPQIGYWLKTGRVARNKIINLQVPEVHSIVRGKAGKPVEFGLKWGFARLRGGYLLAKRGAHKTEVEDKRYVVDAVDDVIRVFGKAPRDYAYDRGGFSYAAVEKLRARGVRNIAVAPLGKAKWAVTDKVRKSLVRERVLVEGSIGAVKSGRYGFHRPAAKSARMMGTCGHLAVLGFNLNKLARDTAPIAA